MGSVMPARTDTGVRVLPGGGAAPTADFRRGRGAAAAADARPLRHRLHAAGLAVALRRRHHPVGRQVAVSPAALVPGALARHRPVAVLDPQRLRRLAADQRPAVADLLAAALPSGAGSTPRRARSRSTASPSRCCFSAASASSCSSATAAGIRPARWSPRSPSRSAAPPMRGCSTPARSSACAISR